MMWAELLAMHHHLTVLGDKGYISVLLAQTLREERAIMVLTMPVQQLPPDVRQRYHHLRQRIESVNSQLVS